MNRNELTDKHTSSRAGEAVPSLERSLLIGGSGFALVKSLGVATAAFGERWMYVSLGLIGAYLAWTALFILLGGGILGSIVVERWRLPKFYLLFGLAFFAYAIGWVVAYFIVRGTDGELRRLAGRLAADGFRPDDWFRRCSRWCWSKRTQGHVPLGTAVRSKLCRLFSWLGC